MKEQQEILEKIKKYQKIIIHRHQRPDPDAIGSQTGLAEILRASFPTKEIFMVGKKIPGFAWIGEMDEIDNEVFDDALIIVTDTANAPRIDDRRFDQGDLLIKIDHHPNDEPYGDIMMVNPDSSSSSEIIYDFYEQFKDQLTLPKVAASALLAGIIGDTGRYLYPATTARTMNVAAALMNAGADNSAIGQHENEMPIPVARLSAYVYENLEIMSHGAAYLILTNEILEKFDLKDSGTAGIVPLPGQIKGVISWAIFVQQEDESYRVRLRSKGEPINEIAKLHDGGGHPLASGAKAKDDNEVKEIIAQLDQLTKENEVD
ncbi:DHH family protein [Paucilactobacillus oligofermentans DSM 15707 = LMG 22743]|uniref:DHH family protein n=1 Tax=Paucilactobacillus oligofermentans DSM 15707 = LMG 22743 TaxID=1423778 RepID=A0A0R1RUR5_9LACO|nr:bifunctional oligoribonuclease/PAP phosphatase NrnA [Paucilactobacillus oligofermentans]KRL57970.1 DHH family protein [Paucilactobacillus oligofermentans DSM 15707 = LMG 22743]CUS26558.1 Bifunctional oligoribonuclease and PAP phosphatase NrnA [Paucilactobacillus oligofermentans DSM 15707 = LMG 22743]